MPYLSAVENVALGLDLRGTVPDRARAALEDVGLGERLNQRANSLSAGERQRVAIARALAADAQLLLADEPTARLDEDNGKAVGRLVLRAARERGVAVVCATHDPTLIALADEVHGAGADAGPTRSGQGRRLDPGPVAQLVEQGTFNPKAAGSSPARPILTKPRLPFFRCHSVIITGNKSDE